MSGTFNDRGQLEPTAAAIISIFGTKGSGKSILACVFGMGWPNDMVVIDVAGDDGPDPYPKPGMGTHDRFDIRGPVDELPTVWPEDWRREQRPMILRYLPDAGSATELEDMDHMSGLAYNHSSREKPAMLLVHEIGRVAPAGRTPANMRRIVNHSRHRGLTMVDCGPRPITVEPLVIAQSDLVYLFEVPQRSDRRRVAENIGYETDDIDELVRGLREFEHGRYDRREPKPEHPYDPDNPEAPHDADHRLVHLGPLPPDIVRAAQKWAHPNA